MSATGRFVVPDGTVFVGYADTLVVFTESTSSGCIIVHHAASNEEAKMRCERLNAALEN